MPKLAEEMSLLELCLDLQRLGEEAKRLQDERASHLIELDAWWAKIEANRRARAQSEVTA